MLEHLQSTSIYTNARDSGKDIKLLATVDERIVVSRIDLAHGEQE